MRRLRFLLLVVFLITAPVMAQRGSDLDEIIGPDVYPEGVNPLTGMTVDDPVVLDRRPILVKISNWPPLVREWQSGLSQADQIWEILVEGGVTRFGAIFLSNEVDHLGPVRSARLADIQLVRYYNAIYANSGGATGTLEAIFADAEIGQRMISGGACPPYCRFPQEGLAYEHTLFTTTAALRVKAAEREVVDQAVDISGLAFSDAVPEGGIGVSSFELRYRQTRVNWTYEDDVWVRSQDDQEQFDNSNEARLSATNVVVIEVPHIEQDPVSDGYWGEANYAFDIDLVSEGRAVLFRNGEYFDGRWTRPTEEDRIQFQDADGNLLPFSPGTTWFQLVPADWFNGYWLIIEVDPPRLATVSAQSLNLRDGPGTQYPVVRSVTRGTEVQVLGRAGDSNWILGRTLNDGVFVWATAEFLDLGELTVADLPVVVN